MIPLTLPLLFIPTLFALVRATHSKEPAPAIVDPQLSELLKPYMDEAVALQKYAWSHPESFQEMSISSTPKEYYVKGASWVRLDKEDFNSAISGLRNSHHRKVGRKFDLTEDKLFLKIEDTNIFDGLL